MSGQARGEGVPSDSARGRGGMPGCDEEVDESDVDNGSEADDNGVVWPCSGLQADGCVSLRG